ncbi:MAG TPA: DUF1634 domain-containing protein [Terracidiphilus sp.]
MNDQRLENIIGQLLRAGVLLAAAVVFSGGVLYLVQHHSQQVHYKDFSRGTAELRTLPGIVKRAGSLDSEGLIQLGLVLLIATPIARVAMAAVGFQMERDSMYVVVSLIVLGVLIYSLMHAT